MNTLFNITEIQQTEQIRQSSNNRYDKEMSKISRPNLRGIASYESAKRNLSEAKREIQRIYGSFVCFLNEEAHQDGTALILIERYEDGESVMYQYDIDTDGIFCECQL